MAGEIVLPTLGVVYIVAVVIASLQHFTELSFGVIGFLAWVVVIGGAVAFLIGVFTHAIE